MVPSLIRQIFNYNAKTIEEFIDNVEKEKNIKIVASIYEKVISVDKSKPRYDVVTRYWTEFQSVTAEGKRMILTKQYSTNGVRAIRNTIDTLEYICSQAPNLRPRLKKSDGVELTRDRYRWIVDMTYTNPSKTGYKRSTR